MKNKPINLKESIDHIFMRDPMLSSYLKRFKEKLNHWGKLRSWSPIPISETIVIREIVDQDWLIK